MAEPDIEEHVSLDLHHLSATYKVPAETGEALTAQARDATQLLVAGLFALPVEKTSEGPVITLPAATTALPREKPVPQPRAETKWEKFAKEKGIKKRKRSKLVYDEQTDEWKRRHGYDRVKDADRIIIADAKMSDVPGKTEDPFTREERERRERVEKNQGKQLKNLQNAVATHGKHVLPPTLQMSAAAKKGVKALPLNGMKKQQIKDLTAQVAKSTASMAKYNAPIPGDEKIKIRGKRRQFDSVTDTGKERERAQGFIDKLVRREKDFTVDVNVAARKIQRAKEAENRSAKKAKLLEKDSGSGGKGGKHGKSATGLKVKGKKGKKGKK